jgi:hypothetical protein
MFSANPLFKRRHRHHHPQISLIRSREEETFSIEELLTLFYPAKAAAAVHTKESYVHPTLHKRASDKYDKSRLYSNTQSYERARLHTVT